MALSQHDLLRLLESLRSMDGLELVRGVAERMLQELIEAEATARIGAEWNEHIEVRTALRNGHRNKTLITQASDLDGRLTAFRARPLDHVRFPYIYLYATYCKARVEHQMVFRAWWIATAITEDGGREVLGV